MRQCRHMLSCECANGLKRVLLQPSKQHTPLSCLWLGSSDGRMPVAVGESSIVDALGDGLCCIVW